MHATARHHSWKLYVKRAIPMPPVVRGPDGFAPLSLKRSFKGAWEHEESVSFNMWIFALTCVPAFSVGHRTVLTLKAVTAHGCGAHYRR
ncbi:hypothetical protein AVEN_134182-1 [Araneus ventricosus]|uniref:Uncharacterized protein n=1 Tax=Araneus ventricosus TaxID=182803 RepID=A0A4Y2VJL0_ARAVE|nr:hypothetical protein AVEN_134182-1 [Araneus ventricosus]